MKKLTILLFVTFLFFNSFSQGALFHTFSSGEWNSYTATATDTSNGWLASSIYSNPVEDTLMFVDDGTVGNNAQGYPISAEGCDSLINDLTGKIAVIYRNTCLFDDKVYNAQMAGAIGAVIINRTSGTMNMVTDNIPAGITIPAVFVDSLTGTKILQQMLAGTVIGRLGTKLPSYLPLNGLVGYWPFNGGAIDESGNGNHGTVNGATLDTNRFGDLEKAYYFDGLDDDIVVANSSSLSSCYYLTINVWIYPKVYENYRYIISKGISFDETIALRGPTKQPGAQKGQMSFSVKKGNNTVSPHDTTEIPLNKWTMFSAVYDELGIKLYVNGLFSREFSGISFLGDSLSHNSGSLYFGNN